MPGADQDLTFVCLFPEANAAVGIARHIIVRRDFQVDVLAAEVKRSRRQSRS